MCERCSELQERVRQLEEQLSGTKVFPKEMLLTRMETLVLRQLVQRNRVTRELLDVVLYGDRRAPPDDRVFSVVVSRLRKKISPMKIETLWGQRAWQMSNDDRETLKSRMISP